MTCGQYYSLLFYLVSQTKDGQHAYCLVCSLLKIRLRYSKAPGKYSRRIVSDVIKHHHHNLLIGNFIFRISLNYLICAAHVGLKHKGRDDFHVCHHIQTVVQHYIIINVQYGLLMKIAKNKSTNLVFVIVPSLRACDKENPSFSRHFCVFYCCVLLEFKTI